MSLSFRFVAGGLSYYLRFLKAIITSGTLNEVEGFVYLAGGGDTGASF
jgi:hypothetical protein